MELFRERRRSLDVERAVLSKNILIMFMNIALAPRASLCHNVMRS